MAGFKVFVVLALAALCAVSYAEEMEEKKDMMETMKVEDDGSYWPGKYERSMAFVASPYHSVIPAVHHTMPYVSAVHGVPVVRSSMFPYAYSHVARAVVY